MVHLLSKIINKSNGVIGPAQDNDIIAAIL